MKIIKRDAILCVECINVYYKEKGRNMKKKKLPYESCLMDVSEIDPKDVILTSAQGTNSPFGDEEDMDDAWT